MEAYPRGGRPNTGRNRDTMEGLEETLHQGYADKILYGGMACKEPVSINCFNSANDLSFPLTASRPTFLNASFEALASFDFSELTGITCLNKSMASNETLLEPGLSVTVPGVSYHVDIPAQLILTEVCQRLNLKLYGMGLVIESSEVFCGWIDMSIPLCVKDGAMGRKKFYGHGCCTKYGAMEAVCTAILREFCEDCDVIIKDFNYPRLKAMEANFAREVGWSSIMKDFLEKEKRKTKYLGKQFGTLSDAISSVLNEFNDVLPIEVSNSIENFEDINAGKILYVGQSPPVTRIEKLAFSLVNVLANNSI